MIVPVRLRMEPVYLEDEDAAGLPKQHLAFIGVGWEVLAAQAEALIRVVALHAHHKDDGFEVGVVAPGITYRDLEVLTEWWLTLQPEREGHLLGITRADIHSPFGDPLLRHTRTFEE